MIVEFAGLISQEISKTMESVHTYPQTATPEIAQRQNRVLRNTYALLALSMVPTIAGALIGVQLKFSFLSGSPFVAFMLFLGVAFGFMWGIERTKNSGTVVALLLGFTFFMGLMLSRILQVALGFANGGMLIAMAAGGTGAIFFSLAGVAATTKRDLSKLGGFLFAGVILLLVAMIANIFFQIPALALAISAIAVALFSAYILYDINRIVQGGEDNYITATLAVYLDIYNVFVSLLQLLMAFTGERD
jgi:modulator of FtsH protease